MVTKVLRRWSPVLSVLVLVATVGVTPAGDDDRDRAARAALALAGGNRSPAPAPMPRVKAAALSYSDAVAKASAEEKPLVVFVGCRGHASPGAVSAQVDTFGDVAAPAVVVGYPVAGRLYVHETIRCPATEAAVELSVKGAARKVNVPGTKGLPAPTPLDWLLRAPDAPAPAVKAYDPDPPGAKYTGARYTQAISVLNDRDNIEAVAIRALPDRRWHQPGGLEGVTGWTAEKYRYLPPRAAVKTWVGNVEVENSIPNGRRKADGTPDHYRQFNRALLRQYPDGTRFDEVLRNADTGKVFEHRVREKKDGKWVNTVYFKDESQRPKGYAGLKVSCSSCHKAPATGGYAEGLVPGADETFSDPLPWELWRTKSPEG